MELDRYDRQILEVLQQDGRISNPDLADRIGLSPSPCLRRVRALEESGLITGYRALLDARKLGLSLMALIVAIGLVVDDAIVVVENTSRHIERGLAPLEAAIVGAREVGPTLLSMNLALVAVFVSILFMGGLVERLFREFSITLVAAILIGLLTL